MKKILTLLLVCFFISLPYFAVAQLIATAKSDIHYTNYNKNSGYYVRAKAVFLKSVFFAVIPHVKFSGMPESPSGNLVAVAKANYYSKFLYNDSFKATGLITNRKIERLNNCIDMDMMNDNNLRYKERTHKGIYRYMFDRANMSFDYDFKTNTLTCIYS